jgi:hypothetical protein
VERVALLERVRLGADPSGQEQAYRGRDLGAAAAARTRWATGALGLAQQEGDQPGWFNDLDPLDALFLGTAWPLRFRDEAEFGNTRTAWLGLLRPSARWAGVRRFVHAVVAAGEEHHMPVDDGELMLLLAGRLEDAGLDRRKLPKALLPGNALADARFVHGPPDDLMLPEPAGAAAQVDPVGAENAIRLPDLRVFMDEPTEHVVASNASGGRGPSVRRVWFERRPLPQRPVRPMPVIVLDEFVDHPAKVTGPDDEQVIQTLSAYRAHPSLRKRIRRRRADRRANDPRAVGLKHRVERVGELRIPIPDHEPHRRLAVLQAGAQLTGLLHHPGRRRMVGHTCQMNPAGADLEEEQDVQPAQEHRIHGEEVPGDDPGGLRPQETPPGLRGPARCRIDPGPSQDQPHRARRDPVSQPNELTLNTPITPTRVSSAKRSTNRRM